jgi:Zn-dependent protease with chaperone function
MLSQEQKQMVIEELKGVKAIPRWRPVCECGELEARACLFFTFLNKKSEYDDKDSLRFILLHEEGHHMERSIKKIADYLLFIPFLLLFIQMVITFLIDMQLLNLSYELPALLRIVAGVLLGLLIVPIAFIRLFCPSVYQNPEFKADEYAVRELVRIFALPQPSVVVDRALNRERKALSTREKRIFDCLLKKLPGTHPPSHERVENIRKKFG